MVGKRVIDGICVRVGSLVLVGELELGVDDKEYDRLGSIDMVGGYVGVGAIVVIVRGGMTGCNVQGGKIGESVYGGNVTGGDVTGGEVTGGSTIVFDMVGGKVVGMTIRGDKVGDNVGTVITDDGIGTFVVVGVVLF
jgi:hypothetical protein